MVFESIVTDLLNKYLGEYVENLDSKQLKIGIWGGDVELNDLVLKESALDDLNLPVKTVYGRLGKLVLKIPWKNLYAAPTEASVEKLFLLVVPNQEIKYDPMKEEKWRQEAKQAEIEKVEAAKKRELDKAKPKADDTFTEKLTTQIVKNVQISIKDIHIRYEDRFTNPKSPFSLGVTLHNFSVITTDKNWVPAISQEITANIFKTLTIDGLSIYWNSNTELFANSLEDGVRYEKFKAGIPSKGQLVEGYKYMVGPISCTAKLKLNTKPEEEDFQEPKALLDIAMEKVQLRISKPQYKDIIALIDNLDRMRRAAIYRRFRPDVKSYRGFYKKWWKYAYQCILEEEVRRRRRNWDWVRIAMHRAMCRDYATAYQGKLVTPTNKDNRERCKEIELQLDAFNIVLIRQKIEVEVERQGKLQEALKQQQSQRGWFSGWWGSSSDTSLTDSKTDIKKQFERAMTTEEKAKLFRAIGYQENSSPDDLPPEFVAVRVNFSLQSLEVEVRDDTAGNVKTGKVMLVKLKHMKIGLEQRPSANALRVLSTMGELSVTGLKQNETFPEICSSLINKKGGSNAEDAQLVKVLFETNPICGTCDHRVHIYFRPVRIIYDAKTINKLTDIFTPEQEETAVVNQLQMAYHMKLAEVKEKSSLGLQYTIQKHSRLDLKIDVMSSHVILPHGGFYDKKQTLLVYNIGKFSVSSKIRQEEPLSVKALHKQGLNEDKIFERLMAESYDNFVLKVEAVQVLLAYADEDWVSKCESDEKTELHLLFPTNLTIEIKKCLISDDPRLPKVKIQASLPEIAIKINEKRLLDLWVLLLSIPFSENKSLRTEVEQNLLFLYGSTASISRYEFGQLEKSRRLKQQRAEENEGEVIQFTEVEAKFELQKISVELIASHKEFGDHTVGTLSVIKLEASLVMQTYQMQASVKLGGLSCLHHYEDTIIKMIDTPMASGKDEYLLVMDYLSVDSNSPDFHSRYGSVLQFVNIDFSVLNVLVHLEALVHMLKWLNDINKYIEEQSALMHDADADANERYLGSIKTEESLTLHALSSSLKAIGSVKDNLHVPSVKSSARKQRRKPVEVIDWKLDMNIGEVGIKLSCEVRDIARLEVGGCKTNLIMKKSYTQIDAKLKFLQMWDYKVNTEYPKMISIVGQEELMTAQVVLFNEENLPRTRDAVNVSVTAHIACIRVVFLNRFVMTIINFLNNFQLAQEKLLEASVAAAEAAKTNMKQAYTAALKVKMNINLKAPIIVVPENSLSRKAMFFNLGDLTIQNTFQDITTTKYEGYTAVVDHIRLNLVNLKVSRVIFTKGGGSFEAEKQILKPITFELSVQRNLSTAWFTDIPDIDVGGRLGHIVVQMSNLDYVTLMSIITENLSEEVSTHQSVILQTELGTATGVAQRSALLTTTSQQHTQGSGAYLEKASAGTKASFTSAVSGKSIASSSVSEILTVAKFNFRLESIVLELFTSTEETVPGVNNADTSTVKSLAKITLHLLSVKGMMLSDGTIASSLLLLNFLVDDTRPSQENKINRYMERISDGSTFIDAESFDTEVSSITNPMQSSSNTRRAMIDATVRVKNGSLFLDLRVFSFMLILNLDHLLKIANFFQLESDKPVVPQSTSSSISQPHTFALSDRKLAAKSTKIDVIQAKVSDSDDDSKLTEITKIITICIEKPDILLVENLDDINTNALTLMMEINVKLRISEDMFHQVITATVKDLQMFTCCYNPEKRQSTKAQVLYPVTISLAGSTPNRRGLHLDLSTTKIYISISPGTIELLNKCYATLYQELNPAERAKTEVVDYSDVWRITPVEESEHWFLQLDEAEDALTSEESGELVHDEMLTNRSQLLSEICLVSVPSLVVTVEAGVSNNTLPVLLLESSLNGSVNNWSTLLSVDMQVTMQMNYYNKRLALWEPLIEPVETMKHGTSTFTPWELSFKMSKNEPGGKSVATQLVSLIEESSTQITITSQDMMEVTVTKTSLEVLQLLATSFQDAFYKPTTVVVKEQLIPPYIVKNETGQTIVVLLNNNNFKVFGGDFSHTIKEVVLETGASIELFAMDPDEPGHDRNVDRSKSYIRAEMKSPSLRLASMTTLQQRFLPIQVKEFNCKLEIPVTRADKRYFPLTNPKVPKTESQGLVVDIALDANASIQVVLCSIIRIHNNFNIEVSVYFMTKKGNEVQLVSSIPPHGFINLPVNAIYTPTKELFFSVEGYTLSLTPFIWKDVQKNLTLNQMLQCNSKNIEDKEPLFIKVVGEMEQVYHESSSRFTMNSTCINIHLYPPVLLKNFLPVTVTCCIQGVVSEKNIPSGERLEIPTCEPGSSSIVLRISGYLDHEWSCKHVIAEHPPALDIWTFDSYDSDQRITFELGMHSINKNGCLIMELYCPFWMLNKTGLSLCYRRASKPANKDNAGVPLEQSDDLSNSINHPFNYKGPIMFSFRAKSFFGKKKAVIKIENGEWSEKFSLDVAGSCGMVCCRKADSIYQIGVQIQLMFNSLTKQIVFTPFYVLVNNGINSVDCREESSTKWNTIKPNTCNAFWPLSPNPECLMVARISGTQKETIPFVYNNIHNSLLRLDNEYGGIAVDIQLTEGAVYITFAEFKPELANALIINNTLKDIEFEEKETTHKFKVPKQHKKLFCWSTIKENRSLIWNKKYSTDLYKDDLGEFSFKSNDDTKYYFVSFLDGMLRVLLLTSDFTIAHDAHNAGQLERFDTEVNMSIHGIGLSLVDNFTSNEILYLGITSSGVIWETQKHNKNYFKPLPDDQSFAIESAYQFYVQRKLIEKDIDSIVPVMDNRMEIDFENMIMVRPQNKLLERTYRTGYWMQWKGSKHQIQFHAKINRLQIDNQTYDCVFPVILAPVPPPKSIALNSASKPFVELSIVERLNEHSTVKQYKYFKMLVQEFHIKMDIGFINSLANFVEVGEMSDSEERNRFMKESKLVNEPLMDHVMMLALQEQKHFYDFVHLSPIKMHVSFSLSGGMDGGFSTLPPVYSVLTQSLGVTMTDMQDVVFKLSYFERQYVFLNWRQLMYEVQMHYVGQLIKQIYVLVFGLDVLGNPYGLVVGLKRGVEDLFYEPFQGAIQGPGEFAEGLYIGMKSLFGHTVGGAAGAMSRITGAMGKGLAALTFDEDYQRKRREQTVQSCTVQESITRGGKGIVMGVVGGLGGVITKPISGAKEDGVEGFFKGFGKGVVGLVTRPTAGVVDFASGTLSSVRRMTQLGEDVLRLRNPRAFKLDRLVRPYSKQEAEGNRLLMEIDKGKFYETDIYMYHTPIGNKDILLLTDKRIAYVTQRDMFGNHQTDWSHTWNELLEPPKPVESGILLVLQDGKKKLFRCSSSKKLLLIPDEDKKQAVLVKMYNCITPT